MSHEPIATSEELREPAVGPENWAQALGAVMRNEGAPGPDGMTVRQLEKHLKEHAARTKRSQPPKRT